MYASVTNTIFHTSSVTNTHTHTHTHAHTHTRIRSKTCSELTRSKLILFSFSLKQNVPMFLSVQLINAGQFIYLSRSCQIDPLQPFRTRSTWHDQSVFSPGAVLAQKFWGRGTAQSAPSSLSPFYPFSKTRKYELRKLRSRFSGFGYRAKLGDKILCDIVFISVMPDLRAILGSRPISFPSLFLLSSTPSPTD